MIEKDGHTDVASSRRMCKTIIEDANDILESLPMSEIALPTWWTNKLAKTSAYMNSARDYLVYSEMPSTNGESMTVMVTPEESDSMMEEQKQVTVGEFTSKHFDICPSAVALYKDIEPSALAVESAMLHDLLFKVEKQAITADLATPDMVEKTQHYADMINELAQEMGLVDEHSYVEDIHMAKMKELAKNAEKDDDDMTPPSVRMMNASKTR
jgi:hypothetical protein|tara:strand:+ start:33 stop:668 length:636 start_codon:yes stop_codon:yes gene_type:complete